MKRNHSKIVIYNIDCLEYLKQQPDNSIDMIITSPPYNLKNKGGDIIVDTYQDNLKNHDYERQQIEILNECYRVIKPQGAIFYNHKHRYENSQVISPYSWILQTQLKLNQEIIWDRISGVDFNKSKFLPVEERIYWLYKDKTFKLKQPAVNYSSIWRIKRPTPAQNKGHKATFPPELIYRIINSLDATWDDKKIVDIYAGTGTVGQVAKDFGFDTIDLIEINPQWNDVINEKINDTYYQETLPEIKKSFQEKKANQ